MIILMLITWLTLLIFNVIEIFLKSVFTLYVYPRQLCSCIMWQSTILKENCNTLTRQKRRNEANKSTIRDNEYKHEWCRSIKTTPSHALFLYSLIKTGQSWDEENNFSATEKVISRGTISQQKAYFRPTQQEEWK